MLWYTAEAIIAAIKVAIAKLGLQMTSNHDETTKRLVVIQNSLNRLERQIARLLIPVPGQFGELKLIAEDSQNMLIYTIPLPPVPSPKGDVVSGEFTKNGEVVQTVDIAALESGTVVTSDEFSAADNEAVELKYTHIDDAGNRSEPVTFNFTATDTIPPAAPEGFGTVTLVREE